MKQSAAPSYGSGAPPPPEPSGAPPEAVSWSGVSTQAETETSGSNVSLDGDSEGEARQQQQQQLQQQQPCASCPLHGRRWSWAEVRASAAAGAPRKFVVYRQLVLSVADFNHPGGNHLITSRVGEDITEDFDAAGHSLQAHQMLQELCVGLIGPCMQSAAESLKGACADAACICASRQQQLRPAAAATLSHRTAAAAAAAATAADSKAPAGPQNSSSSSSSSSRTPQQQQQQGAFGDSHFLVDFSQPLVPQIYRMNNEEYKRVVNTPCWRQQVFKLMPWEWMEPLTKTQWWMVPLFWVPVILLLSYWALLRVSVQLFVLAFTFGLLAWTLVEYFLHRILFHFSEDRLPDVGAFRVCHFLLHAVHHVIPMDPLRLVLPPALLLVLSLPVLGTFMVLLPPWFVLIAWPGGLTGYIIYDLIHYSTHHKLFLDGFSHVQKMKAYHMKHHCKYPVKGFGVSSRFWDYVFDTLIPEDS